MCYVFLKINDNNFIWIKEALLLCSGYFSCFFYRLKVFVESLTPALSKGEGGMVCYLSTSYNST